MKSEGVKKSFNNSTLCYSTIVHVSNKSIFESLNL